MTTHVRLIRPARALASQRTQPLRTSSYLAKQLGSDFSNLAPRIIPAPVIRRDFSISYNQRSSEKKSSPSQSSSSADISSKKNATNSNEVLQGDSHTKWAEEAEQKRIAAQDAALKEILDSAAAEKKQLEEQALKAFQEQERLAAERKAAQVALEEQEAQAQAQAQAEAEAEARAAQEEQAIRHTKEQPMENNASQSSFVHDTAGSSSSTVPSQGEEKTFTSGSSSTSLNQMDSVTGGADQAADMKATSPSAPASDDPLEPFRARLLPYKKSIESSTEYIRSSLPDSLRQLSESAKRKDYRDIIAQLAEHLNNFTGYNSINELKSKVISHGDSLDEARIKLAQAKQAYEDAISTRSDTQKAINDLLQRKHAWSPDDVVRFTDLYRSEHANEQAETRAKIEHKQAEADVEAKSRMLNSVIMERYHEEQVWSDKIRAASTYGTWGLVAVNVMAFLIVQAFVEPRRRRKQVERYEELVQDLTERGILPERTSSIIKAKGAGIIESSASGVRQQSNDTREDSTKAGPISIGGALLGGEDVLEKVIKSTERQEERLDRIEELLLAQLSGVLNVKLTADEIKQDVYGSSETNEFVLAEDGTMVFLSGEEKDLAEAKTNWEEELAQAPIARTKSPSRLSLILRDGNVEVKATRRDLIVSSLGGVLIGGLIATAVLLRQ